MLGIKKKTRDDGTVRNINSRLIQGLFASPRAGREDELVVGFALTQMVESHVDKFERRFPRASGGEEPRLEWVPAEQHRGVICRGVLAGSTLAEHMPVLVNVHGEFLPARIKEGLFSPEIEASGRPFLGYVSCRQRAPARNYFLDVAIWGSGGGLIDMFKSAFQAAALSQQTAVDLQCDFIAPDPVEFLNTLNVRGFSERLPITEVRLVDDLTLPNAAQWTWRDDGGTR